MESPLYVPFDEAILRRSARRGAGGLIVGIALLGVGLAAVAALPPREVGPGIVRRLLLEFSLLAVGPALAVVSTGALVRARRFLGGDRPAIAVNPEGVLIGFTLGEPFFLGWSEIAAVRTNANAPLDERATWAAFELREPESLMARLDPWNRLSLWNSGKRPLIGIALLGMPWPQIEEALGAYVPVLSDAAETRPSIP